MNRHISVVFLAWGLFVMAATTAFGNDLLITSSSEFTGQTNILLQATGNITFSGDSLTLPDLPAGVTGLFSVQAGNDIVIENGTGISAGSGWSLSFQAGNEVQINDLFPTNWSGTTGDGGTITIVSGGQGITVVPGPVVSFQLISLTQHVHETNVTAMGSTNVVFHFVADSTEPLNYQWFKNGRMLRGETMDFLSLPNIRLIDAGNYSVVVWNSRGWLATSRAHLRVLPPPSRRAGYWPFRH